MKILSLNPELICEVPFLNAGRGPGAYYVDQLPVHEAFVDELPARVTAIVATADLQGREMLGPPGLTGVACVGGPNALGTLPSPLLGEVLPRRLAEDILPRLSLPDGEVGVVLAGDFYTVPALDKRGGTGDVTDVWRAFADHFHWVAGVAGNHDMFGDSPRDKPRFSSRQIHYLDGHRVELAGLQVAGLGGIIGNPQRHQRRSEEAYCEALERLLAEDTDLLITHDGPDANVRGCAGSVHVREVVEVLKPSLVIRGHSHWKQPLVQLNDHVQVLNVDARVVVLRGA